MPLKLTRRFVYLPLLGCLLLIMSVGVRAQAIHVDPTFQAVPSGQSSSPLGGTRGQLIQPDGKIVIWSGSVVASGNAQGQILRLNTDGSRDSSFNYCSCHLRSVRNVVLQVDGKLLISGSDFNSKAQVFRLNPDGSTDLYSAQLPPPQSPNSNTSSYVWLVQGDGKSYVQLDESDGFGNKRIFRVNPEGTLDPGFTPIVLGSTRTSVGDFVLHGGKLYSIATSVFISSSNVTFLRSNLDGTPDESWQPPSLGGVNGSLFVVLRDIEFEADGSLLMSGSFGTVNGFQKSNLARMLPAGNVDLAFTAPAVTEGGFVEAVDNGKILWTPNPVSGPTKFLRLNGDGTLDTTFSDALSNVVRENRWVIDAAGRILYYGTDSKYHRLNPNGSVDQTFTPVTVTEVGKVFAAARQSDGKVILAGTFTLMNGVPRTSIARVRADGSLDTSFDGGTGFDVPPTQMRVQADGKILAIGSFASYNGSPRSGMARINGNGTLDTAFTPTVTNVRAMALQSDGRIVIGGSFTSVNGVTRAYLARLLPTGELDSSFVPVIGCCDVNDLLIQPDGKIVIGGGFSGVDGFSRPNLARLTANGALDQTLTATPTTGENVVTKVAIQPNGKYLTAVANSEIRRRNSDGSLDASFSSIVFQGAGSPRIDSIFVDVDGSFFVGGSFALVNGGDRPNIARFSADGVQDAQFFPAGTDGSVRTIIGDVAGRIIIGGEFARINNVVRAGVARLVLRRPATFDFDGDGRSDISVVRSSTNRWYEVLSSTGQVYEETFGIAGDVLAPADYDGDGITDEAIFRPSNGQWWYRSSANGGLVLNPFGGPGDIPRPSDFDGDGKADLVIFRPSNNTWYRFSSLTNQEVAPQVFGLSGDQPLVGDFDGDGKSDLVIFRPSNGDWWYSASSAGGAFVNVHWGQNGDIPVPADFDGDGKTDYAVFRPSDGGWYIYNSGNGSFTTTAFGTNGDRPVAADYDGDGRADIAVFRPSTGIWYLLRTTSGFAGYQFGISTDTAIPGALIP